MYKYAVIFLLSILSLVGCAKDTIRGDTLPEAISAFILDKDKLYVVGQYHDYEFTSNDIVKSIEALRSPPYKDNILGIYVTLEIIDQSEVRGNYYVYFDPDKVDKLDKQELEKNGIKEYGLLPSYIYDKVKATHPDWNRNMLYQHKFYSEGRVVKLENHDEIVQKYSVTTPLTAYTTYYKTKNDIGVGLAVVTIMATLPLMPITAVITSPLIVACTISSGHCE
ncbi:hypothetical protein PT276_05575 [Orbaceae bacterium ESL0721]|nr:hypothetical protein [Orbaceae bacterium ESL0721]